MEAEEKRQAEMEQDKGVSIRTRLQPAALSTTVNATTGVKRHSDKVVLPASVCSELKKQRGSDEGELFWRISTTDPNLADYTVASVLEFTAPEGVIQLPPRVINRLYGLDVRLS